MTRQVSSFSCHGQRGLTIIELMVGLLVGMIVSIVLFSTLSVFEGRKRTSTSVSDVNQSGNWAAYQIDKWVRSAGSGFAEADGVIYGCKLKVYKAGAQILPLSSPAIALPAPFASVNSGSAKTFRVVPLMIYPGGSGDSTTGSSTASDALIIMGSTSPLGGAGTQLQAKFLSGSPPNLTLLSARGFAANDLLLIVNVDPNNLSAGCMVQQVNSAYVFPPLIPQALKLNNTGSYYDSADLTPSSPLLPATGFDYDATSYNPNDQSTWCTSTGTSGKCDSSSKLAVFNLGTIDLASTTNNPPVFLVLGVGSYNTLVGYDLFQYQSPGAIFPISDGVWEMHALYGVDAVGSGTGPGKVTNWVTPTDQTGLCTWCTYSPASLTATDASGKVTATALKAIRSIKAVRIALVMRTSLPEKSAVSNKAASGPSCSSADGTTLAYFCDTAAAATRSLTGSEQNYRYRVIETVIPLRNGLMVPT